MLKTLPIWLCPLAVGIALVGCRQTVSTDSSYPVIYDAWNARYQYNPITREMHPVADGKTIGLSWSRDSFGRLNSKYYHSGIEGKRGDENLIETHKSKLDRNRDQQWEEERDNRIQQIKEYITMRESNQTEINLPAENSDETEDQNMNPFLPISNIPALEVPVTNSSADSVEPIPVLPLEPAAVDAGMPSIPPLP